MGEGGGSESRGAVDEVMSGTLVLGWEGLTPRELVVAWEGRWEEWWEGGREGGGG